MSPVVIKTPSEGCVDIQRVILVLVPGETEQSYSCHSAELYDSDGQRQSSSFWPEYPAPSFGAPQPLLPLTSCPSSHSTQPSEQYCPRVVKRKNTHPQRPDREGQMAGMSAYPGQNVNYKHLLLLLFKKIIISVPEHSVDLKAHVDVGVHVIKVKLKSIHWKGHFQSFWCVLFLIEMMFKGNISDYWFLKLILSVKIVKR